MVANKKIVYRPIHFEICRPTGMNILMAIYQVRPNAGRHFVAGLGFFLNPAFGSFHMNSSSEGKLPTQILLKFGLDIPWHV